MSPDLEKDISDGKIALGGCSIPIGGPVWRCAGCEAYFYRETGFDFL